MMSKIIIGFALLAVALAQSVDNHDEFMEEVFASPEALPYPYQNHVLVKRFADHKPEQRTFYDPSYLVVPAVAAKDVVLSKIGLIAIIASKLYAVGKFIVVLAVTHLPKLLIGAAIAIGICKLTPLCSSVSSIKSLEDIRYYATPERVARATEYLEKAIQKYSEMQDSEDVE